MITESTLQALVSEKYLSDPHYREWHLSIIAPPPGTKVYGLHSPQMKDLARTLVKEGEWKAQIGEWKSHVPLTGEGGLSLEERMIWGLAIDFAKVPLTEKIALTEEYIPAIDSWSICDSFCAGAKWAGKEKDRDMLWPWLLKLLSSEEEWRCRVALVIMLDFYLDEKYLPLTLDAVVERRFTDDSPFYMRMGAAWLLSQALAKDYDRTLPYIASGDRLSPWIRNKAIQKARESFRVSEERKKELLSYKVKL